MTTKRRLATIAAALLAATTLTASAECVQFRTAPQGYPYLGIDGPVRAIWDAHLEDPSANTYYGIATMVRRYAGAGSTVGGQINGWAGPGITGQTWGTATEAVGMVGNRSVLVGLEALVGNFEPEHDHAKIGLNIVWNNGGTVTQDGQGSNANTTGLWITSTKGSGFESAIKLGRDSIAPSSRQPRAAILDLSDMDPAALAQVDLIRLPGGRAIRVDQATGALRVVSQ